MKTESINLVYFSATYTTRKVLRAIAKQLEGDIEEYDIIKSAPQKEVTMSDKDLLIVGMPVYSGRIPALALPELQKFKGNKTPAVIVCVYGNRDYDDALLELKDVVESNGFKVISAGAFIAQHSIFPQVGMNRPDEKDLKLIADFGKKIQETIDSVADLNSLSDITPKGNHSYKIPGNIPLKPKGKRTCTACGTCVKLCPVQAIPEDAPRKTDKERCIVCGRCIVVCPVQARHFGGLLYKIAGKKFIKANFARKEPDVYLTSIFST